MMSSAGRCTLVIITCISPPISTTELRGRGLSRVFPNSCVGAALGAAVGVGPAVEVGILITTVAPRLVGRGALVGVRLLLLDNTKPAPITQQNVTTTATPIPI